MFQQTETEQYGRGRAERKMESFFKSAQKMVFTQIQTAKIFSGDIGMSKK